MVAGAALLCIVQACCVEQRVCCGDARGPSLHKICLRACITAMPHAMMLTPDQDERRAFTLTHPARSTSDCVISCAWRCVLHCDKHIDEGRP